jgi:hypothetical protein
VLLFAKPTCLVVFDWSRGVMNAWQHPSQRFRCMAAIAVLLPHLRLSVPWQYEAQYSTAAAQLAGSQSLLAEIQEARSRKLQFQAKLADLKKDIEKAGSYTEKDVVAEEAEAQALKEVGTPLPSAPDVSPGAQWNILCFLPLSSAPDLLPGSAVEQALPHVEL